MFQSPFSFITNMISRDQPVALFAIPSCLGVLCLALPMCPRSHRECYGVAANRLGRLAAPVSLALFSYACRIPDGWPHT